MCKVSINAEILIDWNKDIFGLQKLGDWNKFPKGSLDAIVRNSHIYFIYAKRTTFFFFNTGEEISKLELIKTSTYLDILFVYMKTFPVCMTASELALLKGSVINCSIDKILQIEIRVQFINKWIRKPYMEFSETLPISNIFFSNCSKLSLSPRDPLLFL